MKQIKADLYRFAHSVSSYVMLLVLAAFLVLSLVFAGKGGLAMSDFFRDGTAYLPFLFIPIILNVCQKDFASRMVTHALVGGLSRERYFLSKYATTMGLGLALYLLFAILLLPIGGLLGLASDFDSYIRTILLQALLYAATLSFGILLMGLHEAVTLLTSAYIIAYLMGDMVITFIATKLGLNVERLSAYLVFTNLQRAADITDMTKHELFTAAVGAVLLLGGTTALTLLLFRRKELK